ncbi:MAG: radical SAM protein [Planctomycetes bacterium]|nr:radical SAM protein [Planctomycetota bacterium]
MIDPFGRSIEYLRVSVTDRCNLRCPYCMPASSPHPPPRGKILSFEEIAETVRTAAGMGIRRVRLTGGEPLVRGNIATLVGMLAGIDGIEDLSMTTNGTLLAAAAGQLAAAGLMRVNVSLDAIQPERYAEITRGGDVCDVLEGINAAEQAGLLPIKLNCVVAESSAEPDARDVAAFGRVRGFQVRFIRRLDLPAGAFWLVEGGRGGHCPSCDRLRLSCDGFIRPCLTSGLRFDVRELGPAEAIRRAVRAKPQAGGPAPMVP